MIKKEKKHQNVINTILVGRKSSGRRQAFPKMEVKLVTWINKVLDKGFRITQMEIRKKAREIIEK